MCGIVGLFLKNEALEPSLGKMMTTMLATMCERGPDSAGFAIYGGGDDAHVKLTVRAGSAAYDFEALARKLSDALGAPVPVVRHDTHAVLTVPKEAEQKARDLIASLGDGTKVIGAGTRMELYKEVGRPDAVARQFKLADMAGTHAVGHTRMATESAVDHRRRASLLHRPRPVPRAQRLAVQSQLAAPRIEAGRPAVRDRERYRGRRRLSHLAHARGRRARRRAPPSLADLDGFYTFVVATEDGFGVMRDPIACKPAVMAETEDYVAFGSEYRALVGPARHREGEGVGAGAGDCLFLEADVNAGASAGQSRRHPPTGSAGGGDDRSGGHEPA